MKCLKDACATKGVDLNKKIYISESLTPKKKKLFGSVNKLKKELKWKFIWTNHGRIYLKKGEDMETHKIDSLEGFENFKKNILKGPRGWIPIYAIQVSGIFTIKFQITTWH